MLVRLDTDRIARSQDDEGAQRVESGVDQGRQERDRRGVQHSNQFGGDEQDIDDGVD